MPFASNPSQQTEREDPEHHRARSRSHPAVMELDPVSVIDDDLWHPFD
jgi:hypothetical protein